MRSYWESLYRDNINSRDGAALCSACIPDFSLFGNRILSLMHERAFKTLLSNTGPVTGPWLDAGCGGGRWLTLLRGHGINACGLDIAFEALSRTAKSGIRDLLQGSLTSLPFQEKALSALSHVTVLQHLPYDDQEKAGDEIGRILEHGGVWILMEHLAPSGKDHQGLGWKGMFPRHAGAWEAFIKARGFSIRFITRFQLICFTGKIVTCFRWIESIRGRFLKTPPSGIGGKPVNPFASKSTPSPPSLRLRGYRAFRTRIYDFSLALDLFFDRLLGRWLGSHIAFISEKTR